MRVVRCGPNSPEVQARKVGSRRSGIQVDEKAGGVMVRSATIWVRLMRLVREMRSA